MVLASLHSLPVALLGGVSAPPLVVLPAILELAVLLRGLYTRGPTDIVLAAVAVPCLVVSAWALVEAGTGSGGVYWGGVFSAGTGVLLALLVAADTVAGVAVRVRSPR